MSCIVTHVSKLAPMLPYEEMQSAILGSSYVLSLSFIGKTRAQAINKKHRNATYVPNVLSFPLSDIVGEMYITPTVAQKEAKKFGLSFKGYVGYLFIHGLLHLKGYPHGDTMEKAEKKYMKRFNLK